MSQIRNIYPALKKKPIRYEVEKSSNNDDTSQHISDSFLINFRFNREGLFMLLRKLHKLFYLHVLSIHLQFVSKCFYLLFMLVQRSELVNIDFNSFFKKSLILWIMNIRPTSSDYKVFHTTAKTTQLKLALLLLL